MHIRELNGKNICILGFGKEGKAMSKALEEFAEGCEITIADKNEKATLPEGSRHWLQVGSGWLKNLEKFDVLIKSPGIPHQPAFDRVQAKMTSPTRIFFDSIADSGATVIGVTGSKGKSTTASLIHHILKTTHDPRPTTQFLIGNIGEPAIAHINDATKDTIFVMELSSYQLQDLTMSPPIAVVTSFFPEHLDYHASTALSTGSSPLEAYKEAKKHIAKFQKESDVVFYAKNSKGAEEIAMAGKGKKIPFEPTDAPVRLEETKLLGDHNLSNIAGAFLVSQHLHIPKSAAIEAIKTFTPLPHRLQSLGIHHGLEWVDDSISTTPESTIAALDALGDRVTTILLGGTDRGLDFTLLAARLKESNVKTTILFPDTGKRIREAIEKSGATMRCFDVKSMDEAITIARTQTTRYPLPATNCPLVLLSPASPSYNQYKNFEERGERFLRCIMSQK